MIKRIKLFLLLTIIWLGGGASIAAAEPIYGEDGALLSEVAVYLGSGQYTHENGQLLEAGVRMPQGIALLPDGSLLVADTRNQLIKLAKGGQVTTYAGIEGLPVDAYGLPVGALLDGAAEEATFQRPQGIAIAEDGTVYIADTNNHAIRRISLSGEVTTVAGDGVAGSSDGAGEEARFDHPSDVAVADDGTIYVADRGNHLIRRIVDGEVETLTAASERYVEVVEGVPLLAGDYADGTLAEAKFNEPSGLALDDAGNLYVSDTGNQLIRYIDLAAGEVTTVAGDVTAARQLEQGQELFARGGFADGAAHAARFHAPRGLAATADGGVVIADSLNHAVRYLHNGTVSTLAGSGEGLAGDRDGMNGHNLLREPTDVAVNENGDMYIADSGNNLIKRWSLYKLPELPQNEEIKVVYGQERIVFDTQPELKNGRTMVPVRAVVEAFGYTSSYQSQTVTLRKGNTSIDMEVGSRTMKVKTEDETYTKELDAAPYIEGDRFMVPLRFFSEEFALDVQWHAPLKTVILRDK
ncbi:stalk domain-containing protein [Halalkalibacter oceani]|uniref:stalk domain-containing protein n=1 Tax=Halalkalibacter oceani TaxID=1653776 RepID=UPI003396F08A